ncbi:MAG: SIS domain-containing protein, partial [Candidatus Syntrophosphaera sp.]
MRKAIYNKLLRNLVTAATEIRIPVPLIGIGCGVLGLALPKVTIKMGKYASKLLRALEYRGYDSTGAAFQGEDQDIVLLKDVGAPSTLVKTLGIDKQSGKLFCGQVRWATFGRVDKVNAQPHEVNCKRHIYGAHNGNITNTRELKVFLTKEGHTVLSDNDGEMLVHSVEHYFDIELDKAGDPKEAEARKACMRRAIISSAENIVGSYAAVVVDPLTQTMWAIKAGSSLYFGVGEMDGMSFALASSDLTAVLRFTKMLVNIRQGEFVEFNSDHYQVYAQKNLKFKRLNQADEIYASGDRIDKLPVFSKLRAEDVELLPEFEYFMEQEIHAQVESTGKLVKLIQGGSNTGKRMLELINKENLYEFLSKKMNSILQTSDLKKKQDLFDSTIKSRKFADFHETAKTSYKELFEVAVQEDFEKKYFFSSDKSIFIDLIGREYDVRRLLLAKAFDSISESLSVNDFEKSIQAFLACVKNTIQNNRNAYSIACGTSFHATKIGALFFNEIANVEIIPILPGDFRGEYSHCIKENDLIIGVSQSGETKDLIDIFNDLEQSNVNMSKVVLVNNLNS